jgi:hypothetical protein
MTITDVRQIIGKSRKAEYALDASLITHTGNLAKTATDDERRAYQALNAIALNELAKKRDVEVVRSAVTQNKKGRVRGNLVMVTDSQSGLTVSLQLQVAKSAAVTRRKVEIALRIAAEAKAAEEREALAVAIAEEVKAKAEAKAEAKAAAAQDLVPAGEQMDG